MASTRYKHRRMYLAFSTSLSPRTQNSPLRLAAHWLGQPATWSRQIRSHTGAKMWRVVTLTGRRLIRRGGWGGGWGGLARVSTLQKKIKTSEVELASLQQNEDKLNTEIQALEKNILDIAARNCSLRSLRSVASRCTSISRRRRSPNAK